MENISKENNDLAIDLISGENYIIFNNMKGKIVIWVNCDKDMAVKLTKDDFIKSSKTLFPFLNISDLLYYIYRGDYIYTDKKIIKPLRPNNLESFSSVPTLKEVTGFLNKSKSTFF